MTQSPKASKSRERRIATPPKPAKQRAQKLERNYRSLLGEGVFLSDADGNIVQANQALARMLGFHSAKELKGVTVSELQQRGPGWALLIARLLGSGEPVPFEARLVRKDGGSIRVLAIVSAEERVTGKPALFQVVIRDITKFSQSDEAIAIVEDGFDTAFRCNPLPMIISTAKEGLMIEVNDSFSTVFGYPREEVVGRTSCELHLWRSQDDRIEMVEEVRRSGKVRNKEISLVRRDGQMLKALWSAEVIHTPGGDCLLSVLNDLTERMSLEAEIKRAAAEWNLTFDAIDTLIIVVGMDRTVKKVNKAAAGYFGISSEGMLNKPLVSLSDSALCRKATELVDLAIDQGTGSSSQLKEKATNTVWDISTAASPGLDGVEGLIVITARDITGIAELQDSLHRSETMSTMGALVAGVAHEVRNPLFSISATLDAFDVNYGEREEYREYIAALQTQVDRLSQLMRDLLEYGRPTRLDISEGAIADIFTSAIKSCERLAAKSGVRIVRRDKSTQVLSMDQSRIVQVFANILANALQYSPAGGVVNISAEDVAENYTVWVKCTIEDSGPGFREEDIDRVFEPFFTRRRGGTGLGLAIVRRIVEEHGGAISASNRPSGGGSLTVTVPATGHLSHAMGAADDKG